MHSLRSPRRLQWANSFLGIAQGDVVRRREATDGAEGVVTRFLRLERDTLAEVLWHDRRLPTLVPPAAIIPAKAPAAQKRGRENRPA
jgi:hypothetical protein